jgi:hypothetical protein
MQASAEKRTNGDARSANELKKKAALLEKNSSLHLDFPNGLWGLPHFDVHQHVFPDIMHILESGLFKTLLEFIPALAADRDASTYGEKGQLLKNSIDKFFANLQPFKGSLASCTNRVILSLSVH